LCERRILRFETLVFLFGTAMAYFSYQFSRIEHFIILFIVYLSRQGKGISSFIQLAGTVPIVQDILRCRLHRMKAAL